ncbi:hypothetical protein NQZ68_018509 [Dissostichus eleginoides]|nr:hypothetical protein NQZ68_018509 [Dissostichus eleginoides]
MMLALSDIAGKLWERWDGEMKNERAAVLRRQEESLPSCSLTENEDRWERDGRNKWETEGPKNAEVSVFEVNIRFVGGLLSAYYLSGKERDLIGALRLRVTLRSSVRFPRLPFTVIQSSQPSIQPEHRSVDYITAAM